MKLSSAYASPARTIGARSNSEAALVVVVLPRLRIFMANSLDFGRAREKSFLEPTN